MIYFIYLFWGECKHDDPFYQFVICTDEIRIRRRRRRRRTTTTTTTTSTTTTTRIEFETTVHAELINIT